MPVPPCSPSTRSTCATSSTGWSQASSRLAETLRDCEIRVHPAEPGHGRGRRPPDRADPAQPAGQRHRAQRGATDRHPGRERRARRWRWRSAITASGSRPSQAKQVFHRFWRADPSRARTVGGTGLGLAIAMEDANLHGGWLTAWGRPGHGRPVPADLAPRGRGHPGDLAAAAGAPRPWPRPWRPDSIPWSRSYPAAGAGIVGRHRRRRRAGRPVGITPVGTP